MLRKSVFRVRNLEIWAVLFSNEVDLLMRMNRIFRLRKRSEMCSAVPQLSCFVDAQEPRIQFAKCSDMSIAVIKGLGFAGTQESCFEAWKLTYVLCRPNMCSIC